MFEELDKVIYKPINYATGQADTSHIHYGKVATVMSRDNLGRYRISIDDFPQCNHREIKNRFYAEEKELEEYIIAEE